MAVSLTSSDIMHTRICYSMYQLNNIQHRMLDNDFFDRHISNLMPVWLFGLRSTPAFNMSKLCIDTAAGRTSQNLFIVKLSPSYSDIVCFRNHFGNTESTLVVSAMSAPSSFRCHHSGKAVM